MRLTILLLSVLCLSFFSCSGSSEKQVDQENIDPIDQLMTNISATHGILGDYQFVFRDNLYSFKFNADEYIYTKQVKTDSTIQIDSLTNTGFKRYVNNVKLDLTQDDADKYAESLNSVVYFVCLPLKLNDAAVNKTKLADVMISDKTYQTLRVTFDEDGGGKDFEDVFMYWFDDERFGLSYLAYSYTTDGGGVRFRVAYNSRMINGMRFQDYINYSAPVNTPLDSLPYLFEKGKLEEVSRIVSEQVEGV